MNKSAPHFASIELSGLYKELKTGGGGLSHETAKKRLKSFGPNSFEITKKLPAFVQWVLSFLSPLPIVLITLSLVSFLIGEVRGAIVIGLMIFLSTTFAFFQEYRSTKAAEKLRALVGVKVTVFRQHHSIDIPLHDVVPGDLVLLSAGDIIPADLRLIEAKDLFINQSALTGESIPVEKNLNFQENTKSLFEINNLCFMGSHVSSGVGKGIVFGTGMDTFFGDLAKDITSHTKKTSFDQGIEKFIWLMIKFMLVLVPLVFLANGLAKGDWLEALLFATAVAVGLTPEMLPLLVTINLAKGAISMAKRKVIVKKLNSIQNLGAMDVLCTDKTGTLTQNEIVLEKHINTSGEEDAQVLEYAYLNSHYQTGLKNLMDEAILKHEKKHQHLHFPDVYTKIDEIPFDFERRRMSVILQDSKLHHLLICKGAFEEVTKQCSKIVSNQKIIKITEKIKASQKDIVSALNQDGFRVVAVAIKTADHQNHFSLADETDLILVGYIAFLDPPKESAKPAIAELKRSGVNVKILTGDNEVITRKVCSQVGISIENIVLGSDIELKTDQELQKTVESCNIFAKLTPHQKSRIISALQKNGHVVGFLGDGINDGPALKIADVSVSVDTAVDIAKDTADIILLEKSLLVIQEGVIEGRKVFGNIMKYIRMSASSNFGNMFSMLGASVLLPFLPMAPVQILLNNFLYDCSQTAVHSDNVDEEYLEKPRVWDIDSIAKFMVFIGPISSVFDYATFGLMWYVVGANSINTSGVFQTGWFVESLLSQTLIVHIIRTNKIPFIESKPSHLLLLTTTLICMIGVVLPLTPLGAAMGMEALPTIYWVGLTFMLIAYFLLTFLVKTYLAKRNLIS